MAAGGARFLAVFMVLVISVAVVHSQKCPDKPGYVTKADTNWAGSSKTQESQTQPGNAEKICNLDANCLAWNNFGYYLLKKDAAAQPTIAATDVKFNAYSGLCTYVKVTALPRCPDKAGYITKADTNWAGTANTQESQTQPDNAEKICNLDANCLAWNNFGYYLLRKGNVAPTVAATGVTFKPYDKLCTYVKESANQLPTVAPPTNWQQQQVKGWAFRNAATNLCFAANDAERVPVLNLPRLALVTCAPNDASQAFKLVTVGNNGVQITDVKGRCLTAYEGVLLNTATLATCVKGREDQLWTLSDKAPFTIKNTKANRCIAHARKQLSLDACNANDSNGLFQSVALKN